MLRVIDGADDAHKLDLLNVLYDARWDPDGDPSSTWKELARILLARGDVARAAEVAKAVKNPYALIAMRVDRQYDAIRDAPPLDLDVAKRAGIEAATERVHRKPTCLACVVVLVKALANAGRLDEALAVSKTTTSTYDDVDRKLPWLLSARANVLESMGRTDEAIEELSRARLLPEEGGVNVSQTLNLAGLLNRSGRPEQALQLLTVWQDASTFGRMIAQYQRFLAELLLRDTSRMNAALTYLRDHESDAPLTAASAQAAAGRLDEAAAMFIRALSRERWRTTALLRAQDYWSPSYSSAVEVDLRARWREMLEHRDVRAAVLAAGRIEHFDIDPP